MIVRSSADPYVVALRITEGSLNFGYGPKVKDATMTAIGAVFLAVGLISCFGLLPRAPAAPQYLLPAPVTLSKLGQAPYGGAAQFAPEDRTLLFHKVQSQPPSQYGGSALPLPPRYDGFET